MYRSKDSKITIFYCFDKAIYRSKGSKMIRIGVRIVRLSFEQIRTITIHVQPLEITLVIYHIIY